MKNINLHCVLLENNEIYFNHRSFGFITEEEKARYVSDWEEK